jgi:TolA-binding protein
VRSIQAVMLSGRRLLLMLLAVVAAAFACYLHEQSAARTKQRKQIADLQHQLSAQKASQEELRKKLQNMNEELERMEHLRRDIRKQEITGCQENLTGCAKLVPDLQVKHE